MMELGSAKSKPRGKTDHVILDYSVQPNVFRCKNCGDSFTAPMPCTVDMVLTVMKQYIKEHRWCKPQKTGGPNEN